MLFKSNKGYSLIEIGIAIIIVGIFMVASVSLLAASNDNYRRIEQRNIALSYAMQAMETIQIQNKEISLDELKNRALVKNNMEIETNIETLPPKEGISVGGRLLLVTVNVNYKTQSSEAGVPTTLSLKTLMVYD